MRVLEFGQSNDERILMFHASCMTWDFLKKSIDILSEKYHVIVPVLPGYDMEDESDYTSIEAIAQETEEYLLGRGIEEIDAVYGISMGGSIVIRMLAVGKISVKKAVIDAGITPYLYPRWMNMLFVWRDYSFMMTLKNSFSVLSFFVPQKKYGESMFEKLRQVMQRISKKTIWNNFKSCNTYSMPKKVKDSDTQIWYWYGSKEKHNRRRDIRYVKKKFPNVKVEKIKGFQHAEFVMLKPEAFAHKLMEVITK